MLDFINNEVTTIILDSLLDLIYIIDIDTYEILYGNKAAKEEFGKDMVGKKCYSVIYNEDDKCSFCQNEIILERRDKVYSWKKVNEVKNKYYYIKDKIICLSDSKRVRLQIAKDISEEVKAKDYLVRNIGFEKKTKDIVDNFLRSSDLEKTIKECMDLIGTYTKASNIEIIEIDHENDLLVQMYKWNKNKSWIINEENNVRQTKDIEWLIREIDEKPYIAMCNINENFIKDSVSLSCSDDNSVLIFPMIFMGKISGLMIIEEIKYSGLWKQEEVSMIQNFVSTISNMIEKQLIQEKLELSQKELTIVSQSIRDIVITVDKKGQIIYINDYAINILGYTREEIIGEDYNLKLGVSDNTRENTYNSKEKISFSEHKIKCKDGMTISVESIISEVKDYDKHILGFTIVSRDINHRKELEFLKLKYKELEQYKNIRDEFLANLTHEFRTPINTIYSCLQLLDQKSRIGEDQLIDSYDKQSKVIRQNCYRLIRLTNNIIDMTKMDVGSFNIKFKNVDIVNLTEDITQSVVAYVKGNGINILFDTELEEHIIKCDPEKLERALLNLISNAIKFTNYGGNIEINVRFDDKWVYISVKDDGIGINSSIRETVFERFVQSDKSLNRAQEGSGIGLYLVKSIVELHSGKVYLDDTEIGCEFIIMLPNLRLDCENVKKVNYTTDEEQKKKLIEKISIEFSDIYDIH